MTIGLLFWILMVLWAVFGVYRGYTTSPPAPPWFGLGGDLLLFVLLLLLGVGVFGWPIRG